MTGGGQIVTFEIEGGKDAAFRFQNALSLVKISNNLGDAKSLITHPTTTTHYRLEARAARRARHHRRHAALSVGLEAAEDLIADLDAALAAAASEG